MLVGQRCSLGFRVFGRLNDIDLPLVAYRLDPPDKSARTAFLYGGLISAEAAGMHVDLDGRSFSAMRAFHGKPPSSDYG